MEACGGVVVGSGGGVVVCGGVWMWCSGVWRWCSGVVVCGGEQQGPNSVCDLNCNW